MAANAPSRRRLRDVTVDKPKPPLGEADASSSTPVEKAPATVDARPAAMQLPQWDQQPIYRVVEVTRDSQGRLRKEGRVWHTDLERMRRFGRAIAANTASHRVQIADASGEVLEELPVAAPEQRQPCWDQWAAIPLPPAPPRPRRRQAPPAPPRLPVHDPFADLQAPTEAPEPARETQGHANAPPPRDLPVLGAPDADALGASSHHGNAAEAEPPRRNDGPDDVEIVLP